MSEDLSIDAEGATRNRSYGPVDHLRHLLKIGYTTDSTVIKSFVLEHNLEGALQDILDQGEFT
jgi:hypothetical protein